MLRRNRVVTRYEGFSVCLDSHRKGSIGEYASAIKLREGFLRVDRCEKTSVAQNESRKARMINYSMDVLNFCRLEAPFLSLFLLEIFSKHSKFSDA